MAAQNVYDDPAFLAGYSEFPRSRKGLSATGEWPADGRQAFAIADYGVGGRKITNWIVDGVVKYHRTIGTMLNTLTDAGFAYGRVDEWIPSDEQLLARPKWRETELTRPMFLLMAVNKPAARDH
jgi:hypothetical protein